MKKEKSVKEKIIGKERKEKREKERTNKPSKAMKTLWRK